MSNNNFRIKKGALIVPEATPTLADQGELKYDSTDDKLKVRGAAATDSVVVEAKVQTLTNKTIDGDDNTVQDLALSSLKTDIADADKVIQRNASGAVISGASIPTGATALVSTTASQTLTNKTIDADSNTISNIENADIKVGAAIDAAKIHDGSVSNTEFGYLDGVTSAIQTQLNNKLSGAGSSTDNAIATWDGVTGTAFNNSEFTIVANELAYTGTAGFVDILGGNNNDLQLKSQGVGNIIVETLGTGTVQIQSPVTISPGSTALQVNNDASVEISSSLRVDNLTLDSSTLSSNNVNGNILLDPNGTGVVSVEGSPIRLPEIATPATPASNYGNLYFKSDGLLYQQNDAGEERQVGAGSGGINYILNPDAESSTTGWATYADAAGTSPVDGTGGAPNVTWTRSTSSPLRNNAEFLFTKDAANRQGQGVAYAFTIASADQAKVLQISFDARLSSGTYANATPDMSIWIYDVTNAQLIQPNAFKLDGINSTTSQAFKAQFQSNSNSTSYRLILHVGSTSAAAYTVKFDNFIVGPAQLGAAAVVTDWVAFTPTGNLTTNTTYTGFYRRVGSDAEIEINLAFAGATNVAVLAVNLPTGLTIDTTKLASTVTGVAIFGEGRLNDSGSNFYPFQVAYVSTTQVGGFHFNTNGGTNPVVINSTNQTSYINPITLGAADNLNLKFKVPVLGWSASTTVLGADAARIVAARFKSTSTLSRANATAFTLGADATTVSFDTHNAFNTSTGEYTVPVAGYYKCEASVNFNLTTVADSVASLTLQKDGAAELGTLSREFAAASSSYSLPCLFSGIVYANAGQVLRFRALQANSSGTGQPTNPTDSTSLGTNLLWGSFQRVAGPEAIGAGESVHMHAYRTTSMGTFANATETDMVFDVVESDSHGTYVNTTGVWTCPIAGVYSISAGSLWNSNAVGIRSHIIYKNSSTVVAGIYRLGAVAAEQIGTSGSVVVRLNAGDNIRSKGNQTSGGALAPYSDSGRWMFMSIVKVG